MGPGLMRSGPLPNWSKSPLSPHAHNVPSRFRATEGSGRSRYGFPPSRARNRICLGGVEVRWPKPIGCSIGAQRRRLCLCSIPPTLAPSFAVWFRPAAVERANEAPRRQDHSEPSRQNEEKSEFLRGERPARDCCSGSDRNNHRIGQTRHARLRDDHHKTHARPDRQRPQRPARPCGGSLAPESFGLAALAFP